MTDDPTTTDPDGRPATVPGPIGHADTCLIVLRGNSGSGKSTIARSVRDRYGYGRGLALVEQDYLRRIVLRERDTADGNAAALIAHTITFALDIGYHVLCEGILHRSRYGPMLDNLRRAHRGTTLAFYLDVPFDETLRRHTQRPQATQFSAHDMRGWYLEHDVLGVPGEQVIGARSTLDDTTNLIFSRLPPAVHRLHSAAAAHPRTGSPGTGPGRSAPTRPTRGASAVGCDPSSERGPSPTTSVAVLVTDAHGGVLVVKPAAEPGWRLPGGVVAPGESPRAAATRAAADDLGLAILPGGILALDHVPTASHRGAQMVLVIDGGILAPGTEPAGPAGEPATHAFVHPADLVERLPARHARRVTAAIAARHQHTAYLEDGRVPAQE